MACNSPIYYCLTKLLNYLCCGEYVVKQRVGHFFHTIIILIQQFYGSIYIENIEQNINLKCFWIDVVQAIKLLWERFYPTNHTKCKWLDTPLC